jgi:hypothetical protein
MAQQKHRRRRKPPSKSKPAMPPVVPANREAQNAAQPWEEPPREAGQPRGEAQSVQGPLGERPETDIERGLVERAADDMERPKHWKRRCRARDAAARLEAFDFTIAQRSG